MSALTASAPRRREGIRRFAPAVALLLVGVLAGLSLWTSLLVARQFRLQAMVSSQVYATAIGGLNDPDADALGALLDLSRRAVELGIPLVVTDAEGRITTSANLPFDPADEPGRAAELVRELDLVNPPILTAAGAVHFGSLPAAGLLRTLAILQALTLVVMVAVAVVAYRSQTRSRRDRLWVAMAREAAHQLGTPLTSLQGWIEQLRGDAIAPAALAEHLDADAEKLQRVAQRFERIGNPARRDPVALGALAEKVAGYFRARLPRHANAIRVEVDAPSSGPVIAGDAVLLEWALEAVVKNAADALQGRGGTIVIAAGSTGRVAEVRIRDDGPGIAREIRRTLFEPGVSTKRGGWGIGLALVRRVVEDGHGGTLALEPSERGTTFLMRFPLATGP